MLAKASCAALMGIDAFKVELEVDFSRCGMPAFTMVGLAEGAVRESKERVMAALRNCGFRLPPSRITVNLAPANLRKEGSAYDLPLALGLLAGAGVLDAESLNGWFLAGELSLTGELKGVSGVLPLAVRARDDGARGLIVPAVNAAEASVVDGVSVYAAQTLADAVRLVTGDADAAPVTNGLDELWADRENFPMDFAEVKGQEHAKRAIEIAAAGGHNLIFIGPPGSGKTMLASRIPTVLPPLGFDEALEVTKVYSVAGLLDGRALCVSRPFRSPHHTISDAGLIGGGAHPRPGEVSLAHRGVLFLDELPEFKKHVLEVLRQPLEDGRVTISRAAVSLTYPADLMLVAAMNPCPCGYLGDSAHACTCSPHQIANYRSRLSGPLLDRIDLHVEVPAVKYEDLKASGCGADSAGMRARIQAAREVQARRYAGQGVLTNADLGGRLLERHCALSEMEHAFLEKAVHRLGLSARAYTRVLRIARTIADLDGAQRIECGHLAEAINYRSLDRPSA
ncbi:magnesium chelatase family protein [Desulfobaculum xiamenense]|uniref:Magnesium chelatase family protein n=1 Tax=Desulfobaculum xiamenense TaxID=995050 RepID=A0A846QXD3_9BACT|nr:YifB family Mg chelatase-like AAA ATPase [Desulfobaculum xiamenense]NJB69279.1 magnesium chelatase family protein [Desulfobaculum xiamenense]